MHGIATWGIGVPGGNEGAGEGHAGFIPTPGAVPSMSTCPLVGSVPRAGDWTGSSVGVGPPGRHVLPSHSQVSENTLGWLTLHAVDGRPTPGVALGPPAAMPPEHTVGPSLTERPPTSITSCAFGSYVIAANARAAGDVAGCCCVQAEPSQVQVSSSAEPSAPVPPNSTT